MPPTSKKLRRHTDLGLSVHGSVHYALHTNRLEIGSWNLIYRISMKNKQTHIFFFSIKLVIAELCPFFFFTLFQLLQCKPMEPCQQNNWRNCDHDIWLTDYTHLINFWQNSVTIWLKYLPFPTLAFCMAKQSCQQNIWRTAWASVMVLDILFGYMIQMTWLMFRKILWIFWLNYAPFQHEL